jgi:chitinase
MPLYGRAFVNTTGPGHNYTGGGTGMAEEGIWHYKVLPLAGAEVIELPKIGASYSYDPKRMAFVTYDTLNVTKIKAEYIKEKKLGGAMWWEVNMDKAGACSLTATVCLFWFPFSPYLFPDVHA